MIEIYRYVLASDGGMAPNPRRGLITLATCKPEIRRMAAVGDWIVGNFPSPNNDVIAWVGRVERCLDIVEYATLYPSRDDALHEFDTDGQVQRIAAKHDWYHPGETERRKDKAGRVLVLDRRSSWYFGANGRELPLDLRHLSARGQGHRVNVRRPGDLERLQEWLGELAPPGVHGSPRDGWAGPSSKSCQSIAFRKRRREPKTGC